MIKYFLKRIWEDIWDLDDEIIFLFAVIFLFGGWFVNGVIAHYLFGLYDDAIEVVVGIVLFVIEGVIVAFSIYLYKIYKQYKRDELESFKRRIEDGKEWQD